MGDIAHLRNSSNQQTNLCKAMIIPQRLIRGKFFVWTNFNPLHPRMLCAKFGWNWPSGSEEDFKILLMYFPYFVNIISSWKNLNKLEIKSSKDALCQVWLKLAQWFCMEKKMKMWKVYKHMDGQTDSLTDRWQIIRKAHLSSGELKKLKRELNFAEIFLKKCTMTFFFLG